MIFLILFAFFVATILISIVLERILRSPSLVAITIFAIYLIVLTILFAVGTITDFATGLIVVIIFAVIAFITAWIVRFLRCICRRSLGGCCSRCPGSFGTLSDNDFNNDNDNNSPDGNLLTISCKCNNGNSQDLLAVNSECLGSENDNNNCCNCRNGENNTGTVLAEDITLNSNVLQNNRIRNIRNNSYRRF